MINTLWYGDNLRILREEIERESVDLIYLDPPFNSNRNYNVLFREKSGDESPAQIQAFTDTWTWDQAAVDAYQELVTEAPHNVATAISAMREFVGSNDMMAYLVMMAQRIVELHRVLKPSGSIYLHCDPTASHYLKVIMDAIFGIRNYRSHITWLRSKNPKGSQHQIKGYSPDSDHILFYAKSERTVFHESRIKRPLTPEELAIKYDRKDELGPFTDGPIVCSPSMGPRPNLVYEYKGFTPGPEGWRMKRSELEKVDARGDLGWTRNGNPYRKLRPDTDSGMPVGNVWTDFVGLNPQASERLGYPTQKPLALLERIILASSNPGDVVLDPFCGCGTAVVAAEKLGRKWIGIDITHLAVALMNNRLVDQFGETLKFEIKGIPTTVGGARMLAEQDRYEFQYWANSLVNAQPLEVDSSGKGKKGADGGIDGVIRFIDDDSGRPKRVVVSVKSGKVGVKDIRDLRTAMDDARADMSMLVTLESSTRDMRNAALEAGKYESPWWGRSYPKCQILTIEELLSGKEPEMPPMRATFLRAQRLRKASEHHAVGLPGLE